MPIWLDGGKTCMWGRATVKEYLYRCLSHFQWPGLTIEPYTAIWVDGGRICRFRRGHCKLVPFSFSVRPIHCWVYTWWKHVCTCTVNDYPCR
jgi:hypothetical protein